MSIGWQEKVTVFKMPSKRLSHSHGIFIIIIGLRILLAVSGV